MLAAAIFAMGSISNSPSTRAKRELIVCNQLGLHARPAAEFVRHALNFRCQLWIIVRGERFNAARILEVLMANLNHGSRFLLEAEGPDAAEALDRLEKLLIGFREAEERGEMQ